MSGQIAAIDRGYVLRIERTQVARIIPIVQVAAILSHASHGSQGRFQPIYGLGGSDPGEVPRACDRQKVKADIGWGGPVGHHRLRRFLEVVWRQGIFGGRDEVLEEAPCPSGDQSQRPGVRLGQRTPAQHSRRKARPKRHRRGCEPGERERQRQGPGGVAPNARHTNGCDAAQHRAAHPLVGTAHPQTGARRRLRRRNPFEQVAAGQREADQGAGDGVSHQPGLVR